MKRYRASEKHICAVLLVAALAICGCTFSVGLKKKPKDLDKRGSEPERTPIYDYEGWTIARASLHNHTIYSDGCRTPEDLLELARQQGMAVLSYNDHREGKICAGKHKLVCGKVGGVESVGYDAYFDHLKKVQKTAKEEGMIVTKGIEVIPWSYNRGKAPSLVINGLQYHFTVYGIEDVSVFENMPTREYINVKPENDPGPSSWDAFVKYIVDHGGIVDAVHVEEGRDEWYGPAHGAVPPVPENLYYLKDLTGFSVLPSGWQKKAGVPGGYWDSALLEYMAGMREHPLWAMADADYHCEASLAIATTLLYMREFTEAEVLACMREGRMVALQGDAFQDTYVAEWWVDDEGAPETPIMLGRELKLSGAPVIKFSLNSAVEGCRTRLIRNGVVIKESDGASIAYTDVEQGQKKEPAFYRVEVVGPRADRGMYEGATVPESELFVNPIFVHF